MHNKLVTCAACCQPVRADLFKQLFSKVVKLNMDLKDFALVTVKTYGYCPFCGAVNEIESALQMSTLTENKLDPPKDPKV